MNLAQVKHIYFIGIGGIGMSALARYFHAKGLNVAGYDKTPSPLTDQLIAEGMNIHFDDDVNLIPTPFKNTLNTLVVFTPAVPKDHSELNYFKQQEFVIKKRAEVLGIISQNSTCFAVAGTHGKTTTSSMLAHILKASELPVSAFLGGITVNYDSNFINSDNATLSVVEADEFDRSFLHLHPKYAIITAADPDHLDIYGNEASIRNGFEAFGNQVTENLLVKKDLGLNFTKTNARIETYSAYDQTADYSIRTLEVHNQRFEFEAWYHAHKLGNFSLAMPGQHNVENALAAIALAHIAGVDSQNIEQAVYSFKGIKRRFEIVAQTNQIAYVDDYAHHPSEISVFIHGLKQLYPGKKITGIFQPHLYSRTRDFVDGFAESLSALDQLILLDIYPARELPMPGITSQIILDKVTCSKRLVARQEFENQIPAIVSQSEVLATIGAGDIDRFVPVIKKYIQGHES